MSPIVLMLVVLAPMAVFASAGGSSATGEIFDGADQGRPLADFVVNLPPLARFIFGLTILLFAPVIARRFKLPDVVGLILAGVLFGPYVLGFGKGDGPILHTFSEVGKLLLLFFAGMEIDLVLFRRAVWRTSFFGITTLLIPLTAGIAVGISFGYGTLAAVLIGSLLASHTLLGFPIIQRYRLTQSEPAIVTIGATVFTDTISLLILAVCVSIHVTGFEPVNTAWQITQIGLYIFLVLSGLSRLVHWFYRKFNPDQDIQMLILLLVVMIAASLAEAIHLESIVGAFMTGLAVNSCLRGTKTHEHIEVLGKTLFIPAFFFAIGLTLDLPSIWDSIRSKPGFVFSLSAGLITAKFLAAWISGKVFKYKTNDWLNMWSLSLPQVAATIAAALVAYQTKDADGNRLIDQTVMSGVLVMVIITAIGGPILTELFSKKLGSENGRNAVAKPVEPSAAE